NVRRVSTTLLGRATVLCKIAISMATISTITCGLNPKRHKHRNTFTHNIEIIYTSLFGHHMQYNCEGEGKMYSIDWSHSSEDISSSPTWHYKWHLSNATRFKNSRWFWRNAGNDFCTTWSVQ
ncbi:PIPO, partial [Spartina mottle virus]